jgi:hypothetical protein
VRRGTRGEAAKLTANPIFKRQEWCNGVSWAVSDILIANGRPELATGVMRFVCKIAPPMSERESIAEELRRSTQPSGPTLGS